MPDVKHWEEKLLGKKLVGQGEAKPESVSGAETVHVKDLPANHRVLKQNAMWTMDFVDDRLNVHVDDANKIEKVRFG